MKRNIIICEYISTGINYIDDVRARGYEPVLPEGHYIKAKEEAKPLIDARNAVNKRLQGRVKIIPENPDYDELLEQVRACDPVAGKKDQKSYMDILVRIYKGNVEIDFRSLGAVFDPLVDTDDDCIENVKLLRGIATSIENEYTLGMNPTRIVIGGSKKDALAAAAE